MKKRRKKSKIYFGTPVHDAIVRYNHSGSPSERNKIYTEEIHAAFLKLAENIINTFKFSYFSYGFRDLQEEVVSNLVLNMHKFDETKGSKAFSYFSVVAKNYLILNNNANLIDASAYNIQFNGHKSIFIDVLSIKEYENGEYWKAHKQFCENFLNPLILKSKKNIDFNNWFKGNLEGITTKDLNSLLSFTDKISYNIFTQVVLLNYLEKKTLKNKSINVKEINQKNFLNHLF